MKRIIAIIIFALLPVAATYGQSAGQAGEFLRQGVGARALGLGRAFTSIADDASALYWNPAGLTSLPRVGTTFMFMNLPLREGASFNYIAGGVPLRLLFMGSKSPGGFVNMLQDLNLGFGFVWHSLGEFEYFDDNGVNTGSESNPISESAFYVSAAYPLNLLFGVPSASGLFGWSRHLRGDLALGVTTKFVRQSLSGLDGSATSFDLGLRYTHFSEIVSLGLMFRDLNQPSFSFDTALIGDEIPSAGVLGVSVRPPFGQLKGLTLAADIGIKTPGKRDRDLSFGLEYDLSYLDSGIPIKVRLGGNSNYESVTFGINFSPEVLLNQDWAPSGDWTYADHRGGFDPDGALYSFSVDRNPFTARYWYLNAMVQFLGYGCGNLDEIRDNVRIPRYLKNAELAKNPGDQAFRYQAALRKADYNFLVALGEMQNPDREPLERKKVVRTFRRIAEEYAQRATRFLHEDQGKQKFDYADYVNSFLYYVQSLLLSQQYERAEVACADSGQSWGKKINFFDSRYGQLATNKAENIAFLQAFALYKQGKTDPAMQLVQSHLPDHPLARYFSGHVAFLQGNYGSVITSLRDIDINRMHFPKHVYLPITQDCTFGDEVLFLSAAAKFKTRQGGDPAQAIAEFAMIPRFFPNSDFGRFLTNGQGLLTQILKSYEQRNDAQLESLIDSLIESYIKSFSNGTLKEEVYTYHYR